MNSTPPSADAQGYLESMMRAGQDAMKQFDDALASATGVRTEESLSFGRPLFPFAFIAVSVP
jgi:polyhydroxyalkanoate synthase